MCALCREDSAVFRHAEEIAGKTVITMNIADEYEYMDEELQEILLEYAEEHLADDAK